MRTSEGTFPETLAFFDEFMLDWKNSDRAVHPEATLMQEIGQAFKEVIKKDIIYAVNSAYFVCSMQALSLSLRVLFHFRLDNHRPLYR